MDALLEIIPVYDRGNQVISLGRDTSLRREGIAKTVRPHDLVLDAGCGPGVMTEIAVSVAPPLRGVVLLDPLKPLLSAASERLRGSRQITAPLRGVLEELPFQDGVFDVVMCGFSLRDARDMGMALREIARVVKRGGYLLVVDLGKPDNALLRWGAGIYWRYLAVFLALLFLGRRGLPYSTLYATYQRLPRNGELCEMLRELFTSASLSARMLGGALIAVAEKAG